MTSRVTLPVLLPFCPTIHALELDAAARLPDLAPPAPTLYVSQPDPVQRAANPFAFSSVPSTQTPAVSGIRATAVTVPLVPSPGGSTTFDHFEPFQCRTRARPSFALPTTHTSWGETIAIPFRVDPGPAGLGILDDVLPFQCTVGGVLRALPKLPTVQPAVQASRPIAATDAAPGLLTAERRLPFQYSINAVVK